MQIRLLLQIGIILSLVMVTHISKAVEKITSGVFKGKLIDTESQKALSGAAIILGLITGEKECKLMGSLITIVEKDGSFQFNKVPSGKYVLFYNPLGDTRQKWESINESRISLNFESLFDQMNTQRKQELFSSLGGGGKITTTYRTETRIEYKTQDGSVVPGSLQVNGDLSIFSEKYGLKIDLFDGKPIIIEVLSGKITEQVIKGWSK